MSSNRKYIDLAEFRALGYLQEINRLVLHPAGLALEMRIADDGTETLGGVWDYRDDPEGMLFGPDEIDEAKSAGVRAEQNRHAPYRLKVVGNVVQRTGLTPEQMATYEPLTWETPVEPCPECAQGKHVNCTELVPNPGGDLVDCPCRIAGH